MINISNIEIEYNVDRLAKIIALEYGDNDFTALVLMNGGMFFGSDLLKSIGRKGVYPEIVSLRSSYYIDVDVTLPDVIIHDIPQINTKKLLIIDDIFDKGSTVQKIYDLYGEMHEIEACCFLVKDKERSVKIEPKFIGMRIPDKFVFGYGMDYNNRYRNVYKIVDDLSKLKSVMNDR